MNQETLHAQLVCKSLALVLAQIALDLEEHRYEEAFGMMQFAQFQLQAMKEQVQHSLKKAV